MKPGTRVAIKDVKGHNFSVDGKTPAVGEIKGPAKVAGSYMVRTGGGCYTIEKWRLTKI